MARIDVACERMRSQRLTGTLLERPEDVVAWFGAIQSQDYAGAKWAVGQRTVASTDADVERALASGAILRTHVLRPTWHLVVPRDVRWMLALTAPSVRRRMAYYDRALGLDERLLRRAAGILAKAIHGGKQKTRVELGRALERAGIAAAGQKLGHVVMYAELEGVLCSGARRGKAQTYALLDERAPASPLIEGDEALAELTRRYFRAHGPATAHDFAWWAGMTTASAKRGVAIVGRDLACQVVDGREHYAGSPPAAPRSPKAPVVRLLPSFDEYVVAYKDRSACLDASALGHTNVLARPLVVVDGRATGSWRRVVEDGEARIDTERAAPFTPAQERVFRAAALRYERFLGASPRT